MNVAHSTGPDQPLPKEVYARKTRFATTVGHELHSPLNLILGFNRLMTLSPERYRLQGV